MHRKNAVVTGASEGIGREFCRRLAAEGYVILAVARSVDRLESLMAELPGNSHEFLLADLSDPRGWTALTKYMSDKHYHLLINNAGYGALSSLEAMTESSALDLLAVNCSSLLALSRNFLAQAVAGDALINVSSILAYAPSPFISVYAATKAFVSTLSEALWYEQKVRGVYVMNLCPGSTSTKFHGRAGMSRANIPKFMIQNPDDVVTAALKALKDRRKFTVIPGFANKVAAMMFRILPRRLTIRIQGKGRTGPQPR